MKEDPTRDPASEARDDWEQLCQPLTDEERRENARKIGALSVPDRFALMFRHASEPRATPETDAHALRAQDIEGGGNFEAVHANISRRLERQRDELLEALQSVPVIGPRRDSGIFECLGCQSESGSAHKPRCFVAKLEAAIAAVKGGQP